MTFWVLLAALLIASIAGLYGEWKRQRMIDRAERRIRDLPPLSNGRRHR